MQLTRIPWTLQNLLVVAYHSPYKYIFEHILIYCQRIYTSNLLYVFTCICGIIEYMKYIYCIHISGSIYIYDIYKCV
jgi:hypothetical protein